MNHNVRVGFWGDFHEQKIYHLTKEEQELMKLLFDNKDSSKIREFVSEKEDWEGAAADALWYDEPFNLKMTIEVDDEEYDYGRASRFVNEDTMMNAQSACPSLQFLKQVCEKAEADIEDHLDGENAILVVTAGDECGKQMLNDATFWFQFAKEAETEYLKELKEAEDDIEDFFYPGDRTQQMCLFDGYLKQYGTEEQLVLIECLTGEDLELDLDFEIEDEFDLNKLKFIYDNIQNPEASVDEQVMLDRLVYDNKLYGQNELSGCHYINDSFVLATINKTYPGWLKYLAEIKLEEDDGDIDWEGDDDDTDWEEEED